jgi:predicted acyl esterase
MNEIFWRKGKISVGELYPGAPFGLKPGYRVDEARGIICEYDVAVRMRDGINIYVNIFRPRKEGKYPVLIAWTPYGKHNPDNVKYKNRPGSGVSDADLSEYYIFEGPDPAYWCKHDYVIIHADPRGAWNSEGNLTLMSDQEAEDCCNLIEWAAVQSWSNANVGMTGVSYLAWTQWKVAALNPPHLKAINPWEGASDFYRELVFHGGIPCDFVSMMMEYRWSFSRGLVEDLAEMSKRHPLFDDYWSSKNADLSRITVPAFIVASWSDHGLHTRGTLEAFKKIASKDKWLRIHGRKKWQDYYQNIERQRLFFDRFLKGLDNEVKYWPRVILEVRERGFIGNFRAENEWPLSRTQYTPLYINAANGTMSENPFKKESWVIYRADRESEKVTFEYQFKDKTEITGYMKLKLWVEAIGSDDMDLFVVIEKIDRCGERVPFPTHSVYEEGPAAFGWLRVSHRELDEEKTTPYQPYHKHQRELKLRPGEIVPAEIEIWPSSTLFERGEKLQVIVSGNDVYRFPPWTHTQTLNRGEHKIYTGGKYDSHLLIPCIP